jgi:exodeoxyribonuclease V alpha subunit
MANNIEINGYIDDVYYCNKKCAYEDNEYEHECKAENENNEYYRIIIRIIGSDYKEYKLFGNSYSIPEINDLIKCVDCRLKPNTEHDYETFITTEIKPPENDEHCTIRIKYILNKLSKNDKQNITTLIILKYMQKMKKNLWKHNEITSENIKQPKIASQFNLLSSLINKYIKNKNTENDFEYKIYISHYFFSLHDITLDRKQLGTIKKLLSVNNINKELLTNGDIKSIIFDIVDIMKHSDLIKICDNICLTEIEKKQIKILKIFYNELNDGNTCVPIEKLANIINITEAICGLKEKNIIIEHHKYFSIKKIYKIESHIIEKVIKHTENNIDISNKLNYYKCQNNNNLDATQRQCIYNAYSNNISIIKGYPGTGKSYVALHIAEIAMDNKLKVTILGPTGKVVSKFHNDAKKNNLNVVTYTIHRYISQYHHQYKNAYYEGDFILPDIIIVDESSMISNDLMHDFLETTNTKQHIVFMGDIEQICPIGHGFPFNEFINSKKICLTELKKIYRGKEGIPQEKESISEIMEIFRNNKKINYSVFNDDNFSFVVGNTLDHCKHILNDKLINEKKLNKMFFDDTIIITSTKKNIKFYGDDIQQIVNNKNNVNGKYIVGDYIMMKKNIYFKNDHDDIKIYEECNICTSNINCECKKKLILFSDEEIFNGTTGKISKHENNTYIITTDSRQKININEKYMDKYVSLSYINTVHKYQGSEAKNVYVLITRNDKFNINWNIIYTAISRSKKKCIIIAEKNIYEMGLKRKQHICSLISRILSNTLNIKFIINNYDDDIHNETYDIMTPNNKDNSNIKNKMPSKKANIPSPVKRQVWYKYIGEEIGKAKCYCCQLSNISQMSFHAGHIISEKDGGEINAENLRPICQNCNSSMGTMNMNDFIEKYGLHKNICYEQNVNALDEHNVNALDEQNVNALDEQDGDAPDEQNVNAPDEQNVNAPDEQNVNAPDKQIDNVPNDQNNDICDKHVDNTLNEQIDVKLSTKKRHKTISCSKSIMDYNENDDHDVKISAKKQHKSKNIMDYLI